MFLEKNYKSWYDLSYEEAYKLEKEFVSNDMGMDANKAMHMQIVVGIITFLLGTMFLVIMLFNQVINPYAFVIMILFVIFGIIIVVGGTIEYHCKFNSWLKVKKRIIKK